MTKRKPPTPKLIREILIRQAAELGAPIPCGKCRKPLLHGQRLIREHEWALALGGPDTAENQTFWHYECSDVKTNGTKATTAGSDKHLIAKGKRLRGETGQNRRKAKIPSRPFPKIKRPIR